MSATDSPEPGRARTWWGAPHMAARSRIAHLDGSGESAPHSLVSGPPVCHPGFVVVEQQGGPLADKEERACVAGGHAFLGATAKAEGNRIEIRVTSMHGWFSLAATRH